MLPILQQLLIVTLTLAFGVLAVTTWRESRTSTRAAPGAAWAVTGGYFSVIGAYSMVQAVLMASARQAGPGTPVYAVAIGWGPAANMGRAVAALVFAALLALAVVRSSVLPRGPGPLRITVAAVSATAAAATLGAKWLHDGSIHQHASALAVLSTLLAVSLMGVLLAALVRDTLDRILWIALAAYALKEVLNVSLLSILAWWSLAPKPLTSLRIFYWLAIVVTLGMCLLAMRRLALARAGRPVPALFERTRPARPPAIG